MLARNTDQISVLKIEDLSLEFAAPHYGRAAPIRVLEHFNCELDFRSGHVLVTGPNGIGKSVFGKTLAGYIRPQSGLIALDTGRPIPLDRAASKQLGIEYIPQFLPRSANICPAEMFWSNSLAGEIRFYSTSGISKAIERLAAKLQFPLEIVDRGDFFVPLNELSALDRIKLFLIDAILAENRIIILDEPTASLSYSEAANLHEAIDQIATSVSTAPRFIMISHPTQSWPTKFDTYRFSASTLSRAPIENTITITAPNERIRADRDHSVSLTYNSGNKPVSTKLSACDICAIVGPATTEFKALPKLLYQHILELDSINPKTDVRFIPENANKSGIVEQLPVIENLAIDLWARPEWMIKRLFVKLIERSQLLKLHVHPAIRDFHIQPADPECPAGFFSGGNRQKIILSRMMYGQPAIVIVMDAFKGLDNENVQRVARLVETKAANGSIFIFFAYEEGPETQLANVHIRLDQEFLKEACNG